MGDHDSYSDTVQSDLEAGSNSSSRFKRSIASLSS